MCKDFQFTIVRVPFKMPVEGKFDFEDYRKDSVLGNGAKSKVFKYTHKNQDPSIAYNVIAVKEYQETR